jgi:hypothetical protein
MEVMNEERKWRKEWITEKWGGETRLYYKGFSQYFGSERNRKKQRISGLVASKVLFFLYIQMCVFLCRRK